LSALFLKKFKELAVKRVYVIRPVLEFEACGFDVISGLLDVFVQAIKVRCGGGIGRMGSVRSRTLINLIPEEVKEQR
jgi:dGTPase